MKKHLAKRTRLTFMVILLLNNICIAQLKKVNEKCSELPCESGLYCVELKDGTKKCATCDQSTLKEFTEKVDDYCKSFGEGWTPESSSEYQAALATDNRVLVDVYDKMLENAKKCKEARETREDKCWNKGDEDHLKQIKQVAESIDRISSHKYKMISDKRVYYGSVETYKSKLSTFKSKCDLNFPDIQQKLSIFDNEQKDGKKVNCSGIEKFSNDCEKCYESAKDLFDYGFSNNSGKFPDEYKDKFDEADELTKKAKELLTNVKSKSLCN